MSFSNFWTFLGFTSIQLRSIKNPNFCRHHLWTLLIFLFFLKPSQQKIFFDSPSLNFTLAKISQYPILHISCVPSWILNCNLGYISFCFFINKIWKWHGKAFLVCRFSRFSLINVNYRIKFVKFLIYKKPKKKMKNSFCIVIVCAWLNREKPTGKKDFFPFCVILLTLKTIL